MRQLGLFLILFCLVSSCIDSTEKPDQLLIAVAANMQYALDSIATVFSETTGIEAELIVSSSGKLTAKILQGAPYDIFLSADLNYPNILIENGVAEGPTKVYAEGLLVLWSAQAIDLPPIPFLSSKKVRKIAIANPMNAPYGQAAQEFLERNNVFNTLKEKIVFGESIAQVNQYVLSKACEAGITAKSVVLSQQGKDQGDWIALPADAYQPIQQGVVITRHGSEVNPGPAKTFLAFLAQPEAKAILQSFGYKLP